MSRSLVSIIVPSFNQGRFIKETLESILNQDYRPLQVLVVDGGSSDETVTVLESYAAVPEMEWQSEPDGGVTDAVNKGLAKARGDIIGIQSSDDTYLPGAIRDAVDLLTANDEAALVYGDVEYIDEVSRRVGEDTLGPFDFNRYIGRFTYIPQPSAFFRSRAASELGGWRAEVSYAADADLWLRIAARHKVIKLDKVMGRYRFHPGQRDTEKAKIARDWERAVRDLMTSDGLSPRSRAFARMGIYLARYKYEDESRWLTRTLNLYRAALANPRGVVDSAFPRKELLFGWRPIWKFLSAVKRGIGVPHRT